MFSLGHPVWERDWQTGASPVRASAMVGDQVRRGCRNRVCLVVRGKDRILSRQTESTPKRRGCCEEDAARFRSEVYSTRMRADSHKLLQGKFQLDVMEEFLLPCLVKYRGRWWNLHLWGISKFAWTGKQPDLILKLDLSWVYKKTFSGAFQFNLFFDFCDYP